ncbi:transcriptional regulator, TetR family [Microbispora rosea]|uniref:Transcriptional regulator, TetR family n=1 Tax=Microbispora rosea TaxID=58117 RepID=A0A1N7CMV0_9ACTN|nr:GntR family transcriptional regulator [Microbispora rosea]GIH46391.1 GntR family transcriptional regulator [Microbispora rosea subsp. rosea]SIR64979.1 transcriptional regulator, TetR family [Microbispora rosea]
MTPPYARIAAELRRRIAEGELAPGDRVPSTRQVAAQWGVALATATRALAELRREGLVRAEPRVGTVVAEPPPAISSPAVPSPALPLPASPTAPGAAAQPVDRTRLTPPPSRDAETARRRPGPGTERELTRERVVRAAIEIADAEGLTALSMRGVAARLGVAAMSPYRYVGGKDDLILLMADAAFGELGYPADPPAGWRERLEIAGRTLWATFRRHPWLAQLSPLGRPLPLPGLTAHADWALAALDGLGLDPATVLDVHILLYSHVQGLAINLEREAQIAAATGLSEDQWMDVQGPALSAIAGSGRYPAFAKVIGDLGEDGYDFRLDDLFELGMRLLLDGVTGLVERSRASGC